MPIAIAMRRNLDSRKLTPVRALQGHPQTDRVPVTSRPFEFDLGLTFCAFLLLAFHFPIFFSNFAI